MDILDNSNLPDISAFSFIPTDEPARQSYYMALLKKTFEERQNLIGRPLTYAVITFGCQMNAHDSEKLEGILSLTGLTASDEDTADIVIYNTCTVRENANQKLYGHLGQLKAKKKKNQEMIIGLCGCMMQQPDIVDYIRDKFKFVDIVFGTFNVFMLAELLCRRYSDGKQVIEVLKEPIKNFENNLPEKRKYPFKTGINIMYGCNNFCTYCIVPHVRGRERSRIPEDIIEEAERFAKDDVTEVMLLGQNVNSYGVNYMEDSEMIKNNPDYDFPDLLRDVCKVDGIRRVRFMTSHPKDLSDKLIEVIRDNPKVCRHIHLPIQAGSNRILKLMNRKYTKEDYLLLVDKIKKELPDVSLTTDIMVGFPGETEEDFLETVDVVDKVGYDQVFTFIYSRRSGTPAAEWEQVPEDVVKERFNRLLKKVSERAAERVGRFKNTINEVLVEDVDSHDENMVTGRMSNNTIVHFKGCKDLIGKYVNVKLTEEKGFYYIGEMV
ncbi:tRNA-2-methylthio-N6-dimethylallyladenosine synthase [Eubacterium ruminantium]|uniref:tRNA-2-methylthio-N(6)-dimethylallyladenosine synthase n=1 Tax=Eubacterium ruminantium TaxID=42322 RepID=A0A1T4M390_9FIRM|nr:tRNA-2-methylthio-N6-dimethylallyladenosine synthase [Eubacterium ruminantium]SDM47245.1 tRNA-2-methylthio-N6-dimethylallyladenosine synthase [Eubacterium ruminantium]SJZ61423.1 tRNA-2-methylthio-N6-dimethylallyladenosine synthase [Eubacterium ruminantium]